MARAIRVKSQSSQNIKPIMKTMVMMSTMMLSVDEEAKLWIVATSLVMVDISAPVFAVTRLTLFGHLSLHSAIRRTHRPQNVGVPLNCRHLLRSVFFTAIRSRACQPTTAPMAR